MCHWFMDRPSGGDDKPEAKCFVQGGRKTSFTGWCTGGGDRQEMDGMNDRGTATEHDCKAWCEARDQCKGFEVGNDQCYWFLDVPDGGNGKKEAKCFVF